DFNYNFDGDSADFEYANAVFLNEDGETEYIDSDAAEELQAAGEVTLFLDPAGNLVYVAGDTANVEKNVLSAIITDDIVGDQTFSKYKVQIEALLQNGDERLYDITLDN